MKYPDLDLCARCHNKFTEDQVCAGCVTDAEIVRSAAAILYHRTRKRSFAGLVLVKVLRKWADSDQPGRTTP